MKFIFCFLSIIISTFQLHSQSILNGSFEASMDSDQFVWQLSDHPELITQDEDSYSGKYSLKVVNQNINGALGVIQNIKLDTTKNSVLKIKFKVKFDSIFRGYGGFYVGAYNSNGDRVFYSNMRNDKLRGSSDWIEKSVIVFTDKSWNNIDLGPMMAGYGKIWYDDIELNIRNNSSGEYEGALETLISDISNNSLYKENLTENIIEKYQAYAKQVVSAIEFESLGNLLLDDIGDIHGSIDLVVTGGNPGKKEEVGLKQYNNFAYLKVPGFLGARNTDPFKKYVNDLRSALSQIDNKSDTLILDLRWNTGGHMWAMLEGISDLFKTDTVGYFVETDNNYAPWIVKVNDESSLQEIAILCLIARRTASSGEAVAITLSGRPRTTLLGTKTRGLATARQEFPIDSNLNAYLTVSYMADRFKNTFPEGVEPSGAIDEELLKLLEILRK